MWRGLRAIACLVWRSMKMIAATRFLFWLLLLCKVLFLTIIYGSLCQMLVQRITNRDARLTHLFPMHPFSTPWKHQKTLRFFWYFQWLEKGCIGNEWIKIKFLSRKKHLLPFLPTHPVVPPEGTDHENSFGVISASPYGSAAVLSIPWSYIKMMGANGLRKATQVIWLISIN